MPLSTYASAFRDSVDRDGEMLPRDGLVIDGQLASYVMLAAAQSW